MLLLRMKRLRRIILPALASNNMQKRLLRSAAIGGAAALMSGAALAQQPTPYAPTWQAGQQAEQQQPSGDAPARYEPMPFKRAGEEWGKGQPAAVPPMPQYRYQQPPQQPVPHTQEHEVEKPQPMVSPFPEEEMDIRETPEEAVTPAEKTKKVEEEEEPDTGIKIVVLQGLNKVNAQTSRIDGPVGTVLRFGNLEIVTKSCWSAPKSQRPDHAAMLEITELKPGEDPAKVFHGWMFSSSPSISSMQHPVYDIRVLECRNKPLEKE